MQVLPKYPRICINLKKFDIETMSSLSICCATILYCKGLTSTLITMYRSSLQCFEMVNEPKIILPIE